MDVEDLQNKSIAPRWQARVATTLAAWLVAFVVVTVLLRVFGDQLGSLPLELRALVLSGVLVGLMANVVMPALTVVVGRLDGR
jgi:antibiotic biosynthesis monooxygenase (ABM) superfamily enzyme